MDDIEKAIIRDLKKYNYPLYVLMGLEKEIRPEEKVRWARRDFAVSASQVTVGFQFISEELRDDKEIALLGVKHNGYNMNYVSERLRADRNFVKLCPARDGGGFPFIAPKLKNDVRLVRAFAKECPGIVRSASDRVQKIPEFSKILDELRGYIERREYVHRPKPSMPKP